MEQSLLGILITLFFFWCNRIICVINIWWVKWEQGRGQKILRVWSVNGGKLPPKSIPFLDKKCDCVYYKKYLFSPFWGTFFRKAFFSSFCMIGLYVFFPFKRLNLGFLLTLNSQGKTLQSSKRKQKNCLAESFICEYFWHISKEWTGNGINRMLNLKSNTEQLAAERFLDNS